MTFTFRPAVRENVSLLIGLAGGSGSGKTFTAMRLATGIAGDKRFCVIDTEAGRAKHYAGQFNFDHGDLAPPFRPERYTEAILAADKAGYPVIVVDSLSHSWAGEGGILDWHEEELERMAGSDWKKREACKVAAWIKPKTASKKMVQQLLQVRAHLVLCFRAEEKIEMVREDGKMKIVPKVTLTGADGWVPICEKALPFELTASILLTAGAPGVPKPIKLQEQHRALFPLDKPISEESGRLVAAWAAGGQPKPEPKRAPVAPDQTPSPAETAPPPPPPPGAEQQQTEGDLYISVDQTVALEDKCKEYEIPVARLCAAAKVSGVKFILKNDYKRAMDYLERRHAETKGQ